MRHYEIVFLVHPDQSEQVPAMIERYKTLIEGNPGCDFAVSGCIYYGPKDSGVYLITGLFESPETALTQFFPPSSLAHRRAVVERAGWWPLFPDIQALDELAVPLLVLRPQVVEQAAAATDQHQQTTP